MLFAASTVSAQSETDNAPKKVIVATGEADIKQMTDLTEVMTSHFRDLNAEVSLEVVPLVPRDVVAQVEIIRQLVISRRAFSAIWVERSREEIFLFVSDKTTQKVLVQTFEGSSEGWEVECETIAALVRSALITWLEFIPEKKQASPKEENESASEQSHASPAASSPSPAASSAVKDNSSAGDKDKKSKIEKQKNNIALGRFDLGFAPRFIHRDEPWTYNARVGVDLLLFEMVSIGVSMQVGSALPLRIPDTDMVLRHFPISIGAGYLHAFGRMEVEFGLSMVSDIAYLDDVQGWGKTDGSTRIQFGMGAFGKVGYRVIPILSIAALAGTDFFFRTAQYTMNGSPVLNFGPTQPFISIGIELFTKGRPL